jgi:hypothetical protein
LDWTGEKLFSESSSSFKCSENYNALWRFEGDRIVNELGYYLTYYFRRNNTVPTNSRNEVALTNNVAITNYNSPMRRWSYDPNTETITNRETEQLLSRICLPLVINTDNNETRKCSYNLMIDTTRINNPQTKTNEIKEQTFWLDYQGG